jgi:hypothetical protein
MEPRMARMRGVRAPHRRTAHTAHPPIRGCAAGCAVGGANPAPPAHRSPPRPGGGVVRQQRRAATAAQERTVPHACRPPVTLSNENALSRFRACPDPHPPASGPQRATHGPASDREPNHPAPASRCPRARWSAPAGPAPSASTSPARSSPRRRPCSRLARRGRGASGADLVDVGRPGRALPESSPTR